MPPGALRFVPFGALGLFAIAVVVIVATSTGGGPPQHLSALKLKAPSKHSVLHAATTRSTTSSTGAAKSSATGTMSTTGKPGTTGTTDTTDTTAATGAGTSSAPSASTSGPGVPTTGGAAPAATYQCDQNIQAVGSTASKAPACVLAENAFYEYYRASLTAPPAAVNAWDPTTGIYIAMQCTTAKGEVTCTAPDRPAAMFPLTAIKQYTPALAKRFTTGRNLGPSG
jgi:hypothetical protein